MRRTITATSKKCILQAIDSHLQLSKQNFFDSITINTSTAFQIELSGLPSEPTGRYKWSGGCSCLVVDKTLEISRARYVRRITKIYNAFKRMSAKQYKDILGEYILADLN